MAKYQKVKILVDPVRWHDSRLTECITSKFSEAWVRAEPPRRRANGALLSNGTVPVPGLVGHCKVYVSNLIFRDKNINLRSERLELLGGPDCIRDETDVPFVDLTQYLESKGVVVKQRKHRRAHGSDN